MALVAGCAAPNAAPQPTAALAATQPHILKIVASTSWVGAFAKAAGATDITVIAPSNIQHPPDYDPKPSDLVALSGADYVLYAGFEGFAKRMQDAVGGDGKKLIMVNTENSPEAIHKEITRLGELFGTVAQAQAFLAAFDTEYAALTQAVQAQVGGQKPVVVNQLFVTPWVFFAGLTSAGTYGPMPMGADDLKKLVDLQPALVFENYHMGGGQPVVEATGAKKIDLINFPGDDLDLLTVFRKNAQTLEAAFGDGMASMPMAAYPVTIENCGRKLTFDKAPERVLTTWQAPPELLVKLGLGDKIIGTQNGQQFAPPAEIAEAYNQLPVLAPQAASKEAILAAKPDFILASFLAWDFDPATGAPTLDELSQAGVQVFGLSDNCTAESHVTYEDMYTDILNIGRIFGVADRAQALVDDLKAKIAAVQKRVAGLPPTKAFFDAGGEGPIGTAGAGLQNDQIQLAGGVNVFADKPNYYEQVSLEEVAARQPEIFVVDTWGDPAYITTRTAWLYMTFAETPAAKAERFVETPGIYIYFGSIRFADGIELMAKAFHPEAFK
ncbi:MAG: ABC transporter substrate-binding protein [Anaerolineales bacterium]|nr:ABC transporter substrate-binding protein [Anaerolineales bacterium]